MTEIRIAQYFDLTTANGVRHRYQNFFVQEPRILAGARFEFAPFRAEGSTANLNGDNALVRVLFPNEEFAIRLVEQGDGNRLSRLILTTQWLNAALGPARPPYEERYVGIGASYSDTTIELRYRTAMDSVGAQFPARTLSRQLVGPLPLNADLVLQ
jgi:hypothetical protein